jgi:hypothetical protein
MKEKKRGFDGDWLSKDATRERERERWYMVFYHF